LTQGMESTSDDTRIRHNVISLTSVLRTIYHITCEQLYSEIILLELKVAQVQAPSNLLLVLRVLLK